MENADILERQLLRHHKDAHSQPGRGIRLDIRLGLALMFSFFFSLSLFLSPRLEEGLHIREDGPSWLAEGLVMYWSLALPVLSAKLALLLGFLHFSLHLVEQRNRDFTA